MCLDASTKHGLYVRVGKTKAAFLIHMEGSCTYYGLAAAFNDQDHAVPAADGEIMSVVSTLTEVDPARYSEGLWAAVAADLTGLGGRRGRKVVWDDVSGAVERCASGYSLDQKQTGGEFPLSLSVSLSGRPQPLL